MRFQLSLHPDPRLLRGLLRELTAIPEAGETQGEADVITKEIPTMIAQMPDAELLSLWRAAVGGLDDDDNDDCA